MYVDITGYLFGYLTQFFTNYKMLSKVRNQDKFLCILQKGLVCKCTPLLCTIKEKHLKRWGEENPCPTNN